MNRRQKNRLALAKLIIFLIFLWAILDLINQIKMNCVLLQSQKNIETNTVIDNLKIRSKKFYLEENQFEFKKTNKKNTEDNEINENKIKDLKKQNEIKTEKKKLDVKRETKKEQGKYYIQIGTYSNKKNAEVKRKKLEQYNSEITEIKMKNKKYYRVIINNISDKKEAEAIIRQINSNEKYLIRVRY